MNTKRCNEKRASLLKQMSKNRASYVLMAPFLLLFTVFVLIPVLS